jgi:glycosyltransferase involved in cell wall biosynthesis
MKVLYVAPRFPNCNQSAAETRSNQLLPFLKKNVDLKILGYGTAGGNMLPSLSDKTSIVSTRNSIMGLLYSTVFSFNPRTFYRHNSNAVKKKFRYLLNTFQPDIVHLDTIKTLCLFDEIHKSKVVFHVHDSQTKQIKTRIISKYGIIRLIDTFLQYEKIKYIEKYMYPKADACIIDTKTDANYLKKLNPKINTFTVPVGFDPDVYSPYGTKVEIGSKTLIFTGSMQSMQTMEAVYELITEIMPLVWKESPDTTIYLVGANPPEKIKQLCSTDNRIILTGYVEDLASYLRSAFVYVCPLRIGSGMKTRVIEALATGCALVSTPDGVEGLELASNESPPWLVANSPSNIAYEVLELLNNEILRNELSIRAASYASKQYPWEKVSQKIIDIYQKLFIR